MAFGISVQTSVEAANSWRDWESCSIVGGSRETRSARTADSGELRFGFMTRLTSRPCGVIIYSLEILVRTFAICYENRTRRLLAFDRTVFRRDFGCRLFRGYRQATPTLVLISEQLCTYRECTASFLLCPCRCGFAPRCSVVAWNADVGHGSRSIVDPHSA